MVWQQGLWLLFAGYALMYAPVYMEMAQGPWETDQDGHGPFIVGIAVFIALSKAPALRLAEMTPDVLWGGIALFFGSVGYILGQSQGILIASAGSQLPVLIGLILSFAGWRGLRILWFPLLFLFFAIPIPGWIMDGLTGPAKLFLSELVTNWLFSAGYPVAQNGIVIFIDQYQLLVRDACVGLNSLFSLSAVGLLYMYLSKPESKVHILVLVFAILPISFMANAARVTILVLITYYLGEEAGQGFLHDFSGILMFVVALLSFFVVDNLLFGWTRWLGRSRS